MINLLATLIGFIPLIYGADILVDGASSLAKRYNIPNIVIGLTIVAVGTSLPELVTSTLSVLRGKGALALGNVVGSNIYNILGILGATALVKPVAVPPEILRFDNWVMLGATAVMILFSLTHRRISRREGWVLLTGYVVYVGWLVAHAAG